jgi:hypothetical protein
MNPLDLATEIERYLERAWLSTDDNIEYLLERLYEEESG